jgi:hypothetical protein
VLRPHLCRFSSASELPGQNFRELTVPLSSFRNEPKDNVGPEVFQLLRDSRAKLMDSRQGQTRLAPSAGADSRAIHWGKWSGRKI